MGFVQKRIQGLIIRLFNVGMEFSHGKIDFKFKVESRDERACYSSGPFCILATRILNYRRNVCRYFVADTRSIDSIRVYGSRRSIDIGTLLRENKQREISRARSNRISPSYYEDACSSLTPRFLVPEYDVKSI